MRYFLLSFLLALFSALHGHAQDKPFLTLKDSTNQAKPPVKKTDSTFHLDFAGTGSINRATNDITYLFNNDLKFGVERHKFSLNFDNDWVYGTDHHVLTNNDYLSVLQADWLKPKNKSGLYYWALASYNTSYSLKVNSQALTGAGLAYNVFINTNAWFGISDGIVYDHSDLVLPDSTHLNYSTIRNSLRVLFHLVLKKDLLGMDETAFLQNSLRMGSDYIVRSATTLSLKLNKWLDLTSSLNYNQQTRTEASNLIFTYGLKFDKYF
ncbi:MAG: DUF481 domain-containing protein [Bacteroidetes bacterium]|nr:DUF481 domain-containing protein [Bacteroidota bacterium]